MYIFKCAYFIAQRQHVGWAQNVVSLSCFVRVACILNNPKSEFSLARTSAASIMSLSHELKPIKPFELQGKSLSLALS